MRRTKLVALTTSGVLALTLAACSSSGPGGGSKGSSTGGNNTLNAANSKAAALGTDATATSPAAPVPGAKTGGIININDGSAPPTMDPSGIYYTDSGAVGNGLLFRTLTQYKIVDGKAVLVPDLATNLGTESADGLTWTFHVKTGIKYSDGSPVKLADYVYAIKRSFAQDTVAANGPNYQMEFLKGGSTYKGPFKQPDVNFPGVTTEGDNTLVFHLVKKMPAFNFFASFTQFSPIPQSKDTRGNYQLHPLTTGPYKVDSYTKGQKMVLSKNPYWDAKTDPVRHQYANGYVINFNVDPKQSQQRILSGSGVGTTSVDINAVDSSVVSQVTGAKKDQFVSGPGACEYYVNMDTRKIPFNIRKIIAIAWPYNNIRKAAELATVNYEPATTYAPPSLQGFKAYPPVNGATGQGPGDPAKAKAMLKAAGKLGYQLSWYYRNDTPTRVAANNAKVAGLEAAGFKVKAIGVSGQQYTTKIANTTLPVNMGQGVPGWCYDWPTGDAEYPPLFNGAGIANGQTVGEFSNPKITKEINEYSAMEPAAAGPKWAALDKQLMTDYLPALPDYYALSTAIFGTQIKNVVLNPNNEIPVLSALYVS
ncbi:ABC transporter substrate-binding protein [Flexivirga caeni]|uniref:Solute-binding protein family 5 domain-containing protein n=1 Tax=Flexivirga caeni TaxID=2294115 RepID=A0A3M9M0D4_9MICO|nr:ABC transporter substrate-binding protein [Flexivirga caeni]RNI18058.1 hypothetical protein EFY87_18555 [Flexivirga caeni]